MVRIQPEVSVHARLLQVGTEVIPVYGDDETGWSVESGAHSSRIPVYRSIDEVFFALVNMQVGGEGRA